MTDHVTAQDWFSSGTRVPYDPVSKKILGSAERTYAEDPIHVFERVARGDAGQDDQSVWTTYLPGFPDGSFGWARVDQHLSDDCMAPKIHVIGRHKVALLPRSCSVGALTEQAGDLRQCLADQVAQSLSVLVHSWPTGRQTLTNLSTPQ